MLTHTPSPMGFLILLVVGYRSRRHDSTLHATDKKRLDEIATFL
jgi:hypothetical protein